MDDCEIILYGASIVSVLLLFIDIMSWVDERRVMKRRRNFQSHIMTSQEVNDLSKEKKLTREQRKRLNEHGITDTSEWVYVGTTVNDHRDSKSLARNQPKEVVQKFRNVSTGEIVEIIQ